MTLKEIESNEESDTNAKTNIYELSNNTILCSQHVFSPREYFQREGPGNR